MQILILTSLDRYAAWTACHNNRALGPNLEPLRYVEYEVALETQHLQLKHSCASLTGQVRSSARSYQSWLIQTSVDLASKHCVIYAQTPDTLHRRGTSHSYCYTPECRSPETVKKALRGRTAQQHITYRQSNSIGKHTRSGYVFTQMICSL